MATLKENLELFATKVGTTIKGIKTTIGETSTLKTTDKTVVGSANELFEKIKTIETAQASSSSINDTTSSTTSAYSSHKTEQLIAQAKADIMNGATSAMDTFKEVEDAINSNKSVATGLVDAVGKRLRIDEAQILTPTQKTAVEKTLNLGDTSTDFAAVFERALS